jgi:hypothetical protein
MEFSFSVLSTGTKTGATEMVGIATTAIKP